MLIGFRVRRNTGFSATILAVHLFLHRDALCTDSRSDIPSRFHLEKFRGTIKIERFRSFHIVPCSIYSFVSSLEGSFFPSIVSARESDEVKKMATLRCGGTAFVFFFSFFFSSQIYTIDGREGGRGRVVLSAQLSEHVTIGQGRLNQSGIDTLRPFSRSGPRALSPLRFCSRPKIYYPTNL